MAKTRILDYILLTLALPVVVWMELNEASRDISLALTGGKYSGYGRLNRKRYSGDDDEPPSDWLRPPEYDNRNFHQAIWRAKRLHYLEKITSGNGVPELVLTAAGKKKILKRFPLLKLARRPWKGWWLVVTFDIPESDKKSRESIRHQLVNIGFVQWQKSVYVSPHDIADDLAKLLRDNNLQDKVVPMIAKRILAGNDWEFARRIFNIDKIEKNYHQIITSLTSSKQPSPKHQEFLRRQFNRYLEVLQSDPFLPAGLAPQAGYGREQALAALQKYAAAVNSSLKNLSDRVSKLN